MEFLTRDEMDSIHAFMESDDASKFLQDIIDIGIKDGRNPNGPIEDIIANPMYKSSYPFGNIPENLKNGFLPLLLTLVLLFDKRATIFKGPDTIKNVDLMRIFYGYIELINRMATNIVFCKYYNVMNWTRVINKMLRSGSPSAVYDDEFSLFIAAFLSPVFKTGFNDETIRKDIKTPDLLLRDEEGTYFGECKRLNPQKKKDVLGSLHNLIKKGYDQIKSRQTSTASFPGLIFINVTETAIQNDLLSLELSNRKTQIKSWLTSRPNLISCLLFQRKLLVNQGDTKYELEPLFKTIHLTNSINRPKTNNLLQKKINDLFDPILII